MGAGFTVQAPAGHEHPGPHCVPALVIDASHAVQTLLRQKAVVQSARLLHLLPVVQRGQSGPPQSTSLSLPFLTPSLQVAGISAGGGGPGGTGVAEATQEPNEQMAEGTPAIEHDVPFAFFLQRHRFLPFFGWHWLLLH
jgi:hypothetical protein